MPETEREAAVIELAELLLELPDVLCRKALTAAVEVLSEAESARCERRHQDRR